MITSDKPSHFNRHGEQRPRSGDIQDGKVEERGDKKERGGKDGEIGDRQEDGEDGRQEAKEK